MPYYYSPIAVLIWCEDCNWKSESYKNALAIAKIHAKKHGHKVSGELTIAFGYNFHQKAEEEKEERARPS